MQSNLQGNFEVLINTEVKTYNNYNDIPLKFDNLIKFSPKFPEGPHTSEEHEIINNQVNYLYELLKREQK